jgi:hypothetical protein
MYSSSQLKALAIAPKFTALSSAVASVVTAFLILARRGERKRTYHRLVLGMSLCDVSASVAWFFTTWPIPAGTPGVYGAVGNQQTCSAQAFFAQFSLSTVMYNGSLAAYYYLVIVKGWKDDRIVKVAEPVFHINAIAWGLGTSLASLGLTLFNQVGWDCWISAAPLGCQESWNSPDGTTTCERGDNGSLYQWAFYYAPLWFVIILVIGLMNSVYRFVKKQEQRTEKYSSQYQVSLPANTSALSATVSSDQVAGQANAETVSAAHLKKQKTIMGKESTHKRVAVQAGLYAGAFLVTWLFPTIYQLVIVTTGTFPFPLLFLTAFCVPIQGTLNLIVFTHPNYSKYRKTHPDQFFLAAWSRMLGQELVKAWDNGSLCRGCLPQFEKDSCST